MLVKFWKYYYLEAFGTHVARGRDFQNGMLREDLWGMVHVLCLSEKTFV